MQRCRDNARCSLGQASLPKTKQDRLQSYWGDSAEHALYYCNRQFGTYLKKFGGRITRFVEASGMSQCDGKVEKG